ncbi:hypothetical protein H4O20_06545 [Aequorivita sp. 609]|uniref:Uncharacterized protein n=1 Tax=Aequorivita xiaoshiensis TaxID=2874476 RepID=A0A9X1R299_9FLAO|nr:MULTISPECIES: hypothetical protein [Aequorivita]MBB6681098.1 hypothetical protein [Aequorivita sp. 609]MCG2430517.1 hypothetical protein [Aequorivita xiaoshiensis]
MKNAVMSLALAILTLAGVQAQENKTVKQESTIKRVVTKKGSEVEVKEVKETDTESGAVIVSDDNQTNQEFRIESKKNRDNKLLTDELSTDEKNELLILENKRKQEEKLEASIRQQKELAAQKRKELEQIQLQKEKELAERRAKLEARPKRMSKLKKSN